MTENIKKITRQQLHDWIVSIIKGDIFASRERLIALLTEGAPHEALEDEFREFFNGYYVLASELEAYEKSVLGIIKENETFAHLKHRVSAVEAQRKKFTAGSRSAADGVIPTR